MKKIFEVPHYVKDRTKYGEANSRVADYIWWLFNHRNEVVSLGATWSRKGSLDQIGNAGEYFKTGILDERVWETPDELADAVERKLYCLKGRTRGWKLKTISVNGGNGADRPNIPVYHVNL